MLGVYISLFIKMAIVSQPLLPYVAKCLQINSNIYIYNIMYKSYLRIGITFIMFSWYDRI